jgi:aminoglycoside phosphotransferase (APT) family kinase protein
MAEHTLSDIDYILRLAFGRAVPTTPIPVMAGVSERMMAFALHADRVPPRVILQRFPPQEHARGFRAFTMMQALRDMHFPVPDVYYFGWSRYTRYALLLMEYVEGRRDEGQPHAFFLRMGEHFAQTLAQLHRLAWDALPDLPVMPLNYTFDHLAGEVRELGTPELLDILDWLNPRLDAIDPLPLAVLHGDYTPHNVISDGDTHVVAILGWENAVLADPRFDVGYASAALAPYGLPLSNQFIGYYEAAAGPVPDRPFWEVLSALRLLTRVGTVLAGLYPPELEEWADRIWPLWEGLLIFVEDRTGLNL